MTMLGSKCSSHGPIAGHHTMKDMEEISGLWYKLYSVILHDTVQWWSTNCGSHVFDHDFDFNSEWSLAHTVRCRAIRQCVPGKRYLNPLKHRTRSQKCLFYSEKGYRKNEENKSRLSSFGKVAWVVKSREISPMRPWHKGVWEVVSSHGLPITLKKKTLLNHATQKQT